jgi:hypothetical protein
LGTLFLAVENRRRPRRWLSPWLPHSAPFLSGTLDKSGGRFVQEMRRWRDGSDLVQALGVIFPPATARAVTPQGGVTTHRPGPQSVFFGRRGFVDGEELAVFGEKFCEAFLLVGPEDGDDVGACLEDDGVKFGLKFLADAAQFIAGILQDFVDPLALLLVEAQAMVEVQFDFSAGAGGMGDGVGDHLPHYDFGGDDAPGEAGHEHEREQPDDFKGFHADQFST